MMMRARAALHGNGCGVGTICTLRVGATGQGTAIGRHLGLADGAGHDARRGARTPSASAHGRLRTSRPQQQWPVQAGRCAVTEAGKRGSLGVQAGWLAGRAAQHTHTTTTTTARASARGWYSPARAHAWSTTNNLQAVSGEAIQACSGQGECGTLASATDAGGGAGCASPAARRCAADALQWWWWRRSVRYTCLTCVYLYVQLLQLGLGAQGAREKGRRAARQRQHQPPQAAGRLLLLPPLGQALRPPGASTHIACLGLGSNRHGVAARGRGRGRGDATTTTALVAAVGPSALSPLLLFPRLPDDVVHMELRVLPDLR